MQTDSVQLRQLLVAAIEQALERPLERNVRRAFLAVERHLFVPQYYLQEGKRWARHDAGAEVYDNRFFFTSLDARGVPNSSSSQPSLMAPMLEALELQSGQRVLEIGTGTGYNAALLGALVGNRGQVFSVDIAADLVAQAARCLEPAGITTVVADGLEGYASGAPYDRIIATGSTRGVPVAWLEQLVVGGMLVGCLALGGTATPLYRLVKQEDGTVCGALLPTPAFFMKLFPENQRGQSSNDLAPYEVLPLIEQTQTPLDMPRLLKDPRFALFIERELPGLQSLLRSGGNGQVFPCVLLPGRALALFTPSGEPAMRWQVEVRGQDYLWSRLLEAYGAWDQQGRPPLEHYQITVDRQARHTLTLLPRGNMAPD